VVVWYWGRFGYRIGMCVCGTGGRFGFRIGVGVGGAVEIFYVR